MTTIQQDVDTQALDFDASNAFLEKWKDAEEPSGQSEGAEETEDAPESVEESEITNENEETEEDIEELEEDLQDDQDEDETEALDVGYATDEAKVKVTVDGQELEASVKDLKRLYGQEASLTRKSQELASHRKQVEEKSTQYEAALETLQKRAEERYKPYAEIDFLVAAKTLEADELAALRETASKAYEDYKFLTEELQSVKERKEAEEQKVYAEKAQETIKVLSDPEQGIPNWGPDLYNDIRQFATSSGMEVDQFNRITEPSLLKMLWKAMRYDKAKKVSTKKINRAPKKVLKSTAPSEARSKSPKGATAVAKLRQTGERDDAVSAFLARWAEED